MLFKNAFSMSPAMMGIHRLSDRMFIEINQVFTEYSGYQWEDIVGHTMDELGFLDPVTLEQLRKIFSERNRISNQEIQYRTKTGEHRYGLYSAILIEDTGEKKILGLLYDITERKHSEALLKLREEGIPDAGEETLKKPILPCESSSPVAMKIKKFLKKKSRPMSMTLFFRSSNP